MNLVDLPHHLLVVLLVGWVDGEDAHTKKLWKTLSALDVAYCSHAKRALWLSALMELPKITTLRLREPYHYVHWVITRGVQTPFLSMFLSDFRRVADTIEKGNFIRTSALVLKPSYGILDLDQDAWRTIVRSLPQLTTLDISSVESFRFSAGEVIIRDILDVLKWTKTHLSHFVVGAVTPQCVRVISDALQHIGPSLRKLSLAADCDSHAVDALGASIGSHGRSIEELSIRVCPHRLNLVSSVVVGCPMLHSLELDFRHSYIEGGKELVTCLLKLLPNARKLWVLGARVRFSSSVVAELLSTERTLNSEPFQYRSASELLTVDAGGKGTVVRVDLLEVEDPTALLRKLAAAQYPIAELGLLNVWSCSPVWGGTSAKEALKAFLTRHGAFVEQIDVSFKRVPLPLAPAFPVLGLILGCHALQRLKIHNPPRDMVTHDAAARCSLGADGSLKHLRSLWISKADRAMTDALLSLAPSLETMIILHCCWETRTRAFVTAAKRCREVKKIIYESHIPLPVIELYKAFRPDCVVQEARGTMVRSLEVYEGPTRPAFEVVNREAVWDDEEEFDEFYHWLLPNPDEAFAMPEHATPPLVEWGNGVMQGTGIVVDPWNEDLSFF